MSQVFYRKYRPQKFEEVVGQAATINILKNAIVKKRIAHAYLFSGSRGTGKTTVARILAREAGCFEEDIIEIDAASSRGIDEARELREAVRIVPMRSPYKIYIIDEVHMLTRDAFNALLKTLEEPPAHVIFILATTELNKVPETVRSRAQLFEFNKIPIPEIVRELKKIASLEGFGTEDGALKLIAFFAEGSLRDAENFLFQLSSSGASLTEENARMLLGAPKEELVRRLIQTTLERNIERTLSLYDEILEEGVDPMLLNKLVLRDLRAIYFLALDPKTTSILEHEFAKDEIEFFQNVAKVGADPAGFAFKAVFEALGMPADDSTRALPLELALIKIATYKLPGLDSNQDTGLQRPMSYR